MVLFKRILPILLAAAMGLSACAATVTKTEMQSKIVKIKAHDGYTLVGKLRRPSGNGPVRRLVIYVNGSGPNTYDNHRESGNVKFDYFDLFAEQLTQDGVAFFSYNTRGVTPSDENAPYFCEVDEEKYLKYLPSNQIKDVEYMIRALKSLPRLQDSEVYLLGWSEGSIIAPLVAQRGKAQVDALVLAGYCGIGLADTLKWQLDGGSSMVFYKAYFDADGDGKITQKEFDADPNGVGKSILAGVKFSDVDLNKDGNITREDFDIMMKDVREQSIKAFEECDNDWLNENYSVKLTGQWYNEHAKLAPNTEVLPTLDLPIYIFHGTQDQNCSVEGVYDIEKRFKELGKTNLSANVFKGHDHDLNYMLYPLEGTISEGIAALLETCKK